MSDTRKKTVRHQFLVNDKTHHILDTTIILLLVTIVKGIVANPEILFKQRLGVTKGANRFTYGVSDSIPYYHK